jgi:hypothetical protein
MKLSVEIDGPLEAQLREAALRLNVSATDLATAAIRDLVTASDEEFSRVVSRVLTKNRELYRRLA